MKSSILISLCLGAMMTAFGQGSVVGVGTDGALWAAGWKNAHVALPVHDEVRVHLGVGTMGAAEETGGFAVRQRPEGYDQATLLTLGIRAYPKGMKHSPFMGLVGFEYAEETYQSRLFPGTSDVGRMDWVRTDVRLLAGVEWRPVDRVGVNLHLGMGRSTIRGASQAHEFVPRNGESSPFTRMIGTELMVWF